MRPVLKGSTPKDDSGSDMIFTEYAKSRRYLINRIGEYCSYCERKIEANLAVEHVQPKDTNPSLALTWSNFLLGCTNCNSTKGKKAIILNEYVWPDIDNTFKYFAYDNTGIVNIAPIVQEDSLKLKIQNTLDLVGLQKYPPNTGTTAWEKASDRRFEHRIQAWSDANRYMNMYKGETTEIKEKMLSFIVTIVINQGFWSIWMNTFENYPEVQSELINKFTGTNAIYFPTLAPNI